MLIENEEGQKVEIMINDDQENIIERKLIANHLIDIVYDTSPESPRDWDNIGSMVFYSHRRYNLGGETDTKERLYELLCHSDKLSPESKQQLEDNSLSDLGLTILIGIANEADFIVKPIYMYDHGGVSLSHSSFNDPWDSGLAGFSYTTKEEIARECGFTENDPEILVTANNILDGNLRAYSNYLNGDVYGYQIRELEVFKSKDRELLVATDVIDSCYNYYEIEDALKAALENIPKEQESSPSFG